MDIIHGQICFSILASFTLFMALFGGQGFDPRFLAAHLCGGGVVLGAFFMASDYATSPVSKLGQMIYGILIGVLGALFRLRSGSADSFSYSVIIGNLFVPLIDMFIVPKPFAYTRAAMKARTGEKKPLKDRIPRPVIALAVITLVAGAALSGVYSATKDTSEAQKLAARAASYRSVLPAAASFEPVSSVSNAIEDLDGGVYGSGFGRVYINESYAAKDENGAVIGHVINVTSADGMDGDITLVLGITNADMLTGIDFIELNETPGMGMRAAEPAFKDQFSGRMVSGFTLNKSGGSNAPDQIDAISGATVTSSAVTNAVNAGLDFYYNVIKGGM